MGIKCSLFGHAFGETTVEREREEQGSEVVITIREIETCNRCGETRVVSENKEVTTVETPEDVSLDAESAVEAATDGEPVEGDDAVDAAGGAEIVDAEAGEPLSSDVEESAPEQEPAEPPIDGPSAAEDDGVILEDDEQSDREPGEWPEEPNEEPAQAVQPDDELEDGPAEPETPETPSGESDVWSATDPDLESDQSAGDVGGVPTGQFRCSDCGYTAAIESSSLREGDYCPQCHQGTLRRELE